VRWWLAAAAGALAVALGLWPFALAPPTPQGAGVSALAVAAIAVALVTGRWILVAPGIILFVLHYAVALVRSSGIDPLAPLVGLGFVALVELFDLSLLAARPGAVWPAVVVARARYACLAGAVGGAGAAAALAASVGDIAGHPLILAAAAGAGAAALGTVVWLARSVVDQT
jgi:hypothetical protein